MARVGAIYAAHRVQRLIGVPKRQQAFAARKHVREAGILEDTGAP